MFRAARAKALYHSIRAAMSVAPPQIPGPQAFEPRPGELVANRYRLEREIARGGMGAVWAAEDPKLRRAVAIKLLAGSWGASEDARRRFEREAMAVAQLSCPQVVQIFDYGVERDVPFIVMELLDGEDLQKRLKHEKRLTVETAVSVVWQTARALGVAHAAGIIHRDLKPGNVFLVRQGEEELVKVLDFGVAKTRFDPVDDTRKSGGALIGTPHHRIDVGAEATKVGTLLGTPQYMSPEQASGLAKLDHRADLWSLAAIAYRMLTGKLPFNGRTAAEVIAKVVGGPPPLPSSVVSDLPFELDAFFERAFARDPAHRYQSARELARALASISSMSMPTMSVPEPRLPMTSDPSWPDAFGPESGIRSGKFTPRPPSSYPGRAFLDESSVPPTSPSGSARLAALTAESTLPAGASLPAPPPSSLPPSSAAATPGVGVGVESAPPRRRRWITALAAMMLIGAGAVVAAIASGELPWRAWWSELMSGPDTTPSTTNTTANEPTTPSVTAAEPTVVPTVPAPAASSAPGDDAPVAAESAAERPGARPGARPPRSAPKDKPAPPTEVKPPTPAQPADPFADRL
jgi:serine/threonine-protein kinase